MANYGTPSRLVSSHFERFPKLQNLGKILNTNLRADAIDTNIFTLYTQGELSDKGNDLIDSILNSFSCQILVITRIELLSWNTDEETMK